MSGLRRWHVLQTVPRKEALATFFAEHEGFAVASPTVEMLVIGRPGPRALYGRERKTVLKTVPMFPGYVFVAFDRSDPSWRMLATMLGVRRLLGDSPEAPAPVPDGLVERLLDRPCETLDDLAAKRRISAGVDGRVTGGPFEDRVGPCTYSSAERVILLLDWLGAPRPVAFDPDLVTAI
jgi:transcription antitermination factor NusG